MTRRSGIGQRVAAMALLAALWAATPARAAEVTFATPGLITAIGQSADAMVVKVLLNAQLKLGLAFKPLAQVGDLAGMKTIVMVVGASAKGLGAAGLDMDKELARTRALLEAARAQGAQVLVMHTGGKARRSKTSNDLIEVAIPGASYVVVVASGNQDKLFQTLASKRNTPVVEVEKLSGIGDVVRGLFRQ